MHSNHITYFILKYNVNLYLQVSGILTNTGHSVAFRISSLHPSVPINISGGPLSYKYRFHELHLHYGRTDDRGSEHTVSGTSFPGEVRISAIYFVRCFNVVHASLLTIFM